MYVLCCSTMTFLVCGMYEYEENGSSCCKFDSAIQANREKAQSMFKLFKQQAIVCHLKFHFFLHSPMLNTPDANANTTAIYILTVCRIKVQVIKTQFFTLVYISMVASISFTFQSILSRVNKISNFDSVCIDSFFIFFWKGNPSEQKCFHP